uniref:Trimeric intracellular cation channel type B n=1 Tax=Trichuris muris TaxID=70415 RepID=A0A5S6QBK4_TRIMR
MEISPEAVHEFSHIVANLKLYPYFDLAHYIMMTIAVREDLASGSITFSRKHPLSCWLSSMMMCFAGSFLANFLLGESLMLPLRHHDDVILASIVWYLIFYSPFDICYRLVKFFPVKLLVTMAKEVQRTNKVYSGVVHAMKLYPNSYLVMVIVGAAKGAGSNVVRTFEQLVRGVWLPSSNEILRPTFSTKACILVSVFFVLEKKTDLINAPHDMIYFCVVSFFVYFKLSSIIFNIRDPFVPFENLFCAIFMGGFWDALNRAVNTSRERRSGIQGVTDQANPSSVREAKKDQ